MSEITMPAELMAAMNIFGGSAGIAPVDSEDASQSGSFGSILGLLMANTAQVQVPMQAVPETAEAEASPETAVCDILAAALAGDENVRLPEEFTEKSAKAFIRTVSRFLENDGKELDRKEIDELWEDVSPKEKSAFAELLEAAVNISEEDMSENEETPADIVSSIARLALKTVKKPVKKASEEKSTADEAAIVSEISVRVFPVQAAISSVQTEDSVVRSEVSPVQTEASPVQSAAYDMPADVSAAAEEVSYNSGNVQKADSTPVYTEEPADAVAPTDADNKLTADFKSVCEKLSEADPEEVMTFCRKLADKLNASAEAEAADTASPEAEHIDFGRQNLQSFMARINKPLENDMPAEAVIPQSNAAADPSQSASVSEGEDISSQIIRRIDLYRDIFADHFSEKEIEMKLSPEELGGLEIKIKRSDKGFEIAFTAERAEAAELISKRTSELAETMASRGIALREISVSRQITVSESDGSLTGNSFSSGDGLYGGAQHRSGSERHFTESGGYSSDSSSEQTDEDAEIIYNREAKLWVSA